MIFVSLDYSPWSEKARWAMDHSGLNYTNKPYLSMLGAPWLRLKTKKFTGPVTVPVLFDDQKTLTDSYDIAVYADSKRSNSESNTLFPCMTTTQEWNQLSEMALTIGRYQCVKRQLNNKQAQQEVLPPFIPGAIKPYFTWLAKSGLQYHLKKYKVEDNELKFYRSILLKLRNTLAGERYILNDFSYCDIAMALALQYLKPVNHKYSAQGPAAAECWSSPELLEEFSDLIEWRDWIYKHHR